MGAAASTDRAERGRRDGHSEAPTTATLSTIPEDLAAVDVRRKGCKVSPEPKEQGEEPAAPLPGSPSFRIYCQNAARVDALVAAAYADGGDNDEPAMTIETSLAIRKNDLGHGSGELSKSKESSGWLKFRGQAFVDVLYGLIVCRSKAASAHTPPPHPPAALVAAKPHHQPCAASPPRLAPVPEPYL